MYIYMHIYVYIYVYIYTLAEKQSAMELQQLWCIMIQSISQSVRVCVYIYICMYIYIRRPRWGGAQNLD